MLYLHFCSILSHGIMTKIIPKIIFINETANILGSISFDSNLAKIKYRKKLTRPICKITYYKELIKAVGILILVYAGTGYTFA
jgi:hypothetical protein